MSTPTDAGLAPCPFCGGAAKATTLFGADHIHCENGCVDLFPSRTEAIAAWNRRALPAEPAPSPASQPVAGRCSKCGGRTFARMDAARPDGTFGPGDYVRCVECKEVYLSAISPTQPAEAVPVGYTSLTDLAAIQQSGAFNLGTIYPAPLPSENVPLFATPQPSPASGVEDALRDALHFITNIDNSHPVVRKLRAALGDRK